MKFKHIETFRVVMLTRSMTLAAGELHTSQSNISRVIGQLEAATGFRLFDRRPGGLIPTPEAEAFYREVQRAFLGMDALADAARLIRQVGPGTLRIGAVPSIAMSVMPEVMRKFRQHYPDVPVSIHTGDSPTVAKWTATSYCDLGLVSYLADTPGVAVTLWAEDEGVCIVPNGHRLARKRRVNAGDLVDEPFVSLTQGDGTRAAIDAAFSPDRRKLILDTPYAATICRMVAMGLGLSVVNPLVIRTLKIPGVTSLPLSPTIVFSRYILTAQQQAESSLTAAFLGCLRDE